MATKAVVDLFLRACRCLNKTAGQTAELDDLEYFVVASAGTTMGSVALD
jgi:hypothetical protein